MTESLTIKRMRILKEADGKILYKDGNDNKVKLYYN